MSVLTKYGRTGYELLRHIGFPGPAPWDFPLPPLIWLQARLQSRHAMIDLSKQKRHVNRMRNWDGSIYVKKNPRFCYFSKKKVGDSFWWTGLYRLVFSFDSPWVQRWKGHRNETEATGILDGRWNWCRCPFQWTSKSYFLNSIYGWVS